MGWNPTLPFDVTIAPNKYHLANSKPLDRTHLIKAPIQLDDHIWIGRLDSSLSDAIMDACEARGENFQPIRQFGNQYAVVNTAPNQGGNTLEWDSDRSISRIVRLSRLIYPTSLAYEYAARVETGPDGARRIVPARTRGCGTTAYVSDPTRDWLTKDHIAQLSVLMAASSGLSIPDRIKSAWFYFEYAAWMYYTDVRWPLLAAAAESLVHVDGERDPRNPSRFAGSTYVFVRRLMLVQDKVEHVGFTEPALREIYSHRSALAHGQPFDWLEPRVKDLYALFENGLRVILRRAVSDHGIASLFADAATVQSAFTLE